MGNKRRSMYPAAVVGRFAIDRWVCVQANDVVLVVPEVSACSVSLPLLLLLLLSCKVVRPRRHVSTVVETHEEASADDLVLEEGGDNDTTEGEGDEDCDGTERASVEGTQSRCRTASNRIAGILAAFRNREKREMLFLLLWWISIADCCIVVSHPTFVFVLILLVFDGSVLPCSEQSSLRGSNEQYR